MAASTPLPTLAATPLRLRQVCLAAPRLEPVLDDLQAIFGLKVCHRDPGLIAYGLENALLPVGTDFIEVVSPVQADTAAGRFIHRTRGHGGYMAIFQASDPVQRRTHAASLGVRTAHEITRPGYQSVQLHPRDCRAAFIELGHSPGGEDRLGTWWPAGEAWQPHIRTTHTRRLAGIVLESPDPEDLARHWAAILQLPLGRHGDAPALLVEGSFISAVHGPADALGRLVLEVADVPATLARALERGYWVQGQGFHLAGVHFQVVPG